MMKKLRILTLITGLVLIILYLSIEWHWLETTQRLPYMNLKVRGSSSCYVYFNIENRGKVYRVVMPNGLADGALVRRKSFLLSTFYSLYMAEMMRYDLSIGVDDSLFNEIKFFTIEDGAVNKFVEHDILNDTLLVDKDGRLVRNLTMEDRDAIIYTLLKNGTNCCVQDISGNIFVSQ